MSGICLNNLVSTRGEKIDQRLKAIGESPAWLAKQLKVPRQSVYNWIDGVKPQDDTVWARMAPLLKVPLDLLLDDEIDLPSVGGMDRFDEEIELPRWPNLPASENWDIDPTTVTATERVPAMFGRKRPTDPPRICAFVEGQSMEPRINAGDLVVVELVKANRPGRIALARSEEGRTLKVLRRPHGGKPELHSINPEHGQAKAAHWEVEGYVVAILKDYEKKRGLAEWDDDGIGP